LEIFEKEQISIGKRIQTLRLSLLVTTGVFFRILEVILEAFISLPVLGVLGEAKSGFGMISMVWKMNDSLPILIKYRLLDQNVESV
jgi:hypothetical protein